MHQRIDLAAGAINASDRIVIELIVPPDTPPVIAINWPLKACVSTVDAFPAAASKAASLFAQASTRLSQLRRERRLGLARTSEPNGSVAN
jgi:hypothetical protein